MAIQVIKMGSNTSPQIVQAIQNKLNEARSMGTDIGVEGVLAVDGVFGPQTDAALRAFQKAKGLKPDGVAGEKTLAALANKPDYQSPPKWAPKARGNIIELDVEDVVHRALMCVKAPVRYHLEYPNGGTDPTANLPCDEHTHFLDCSGFNAWVQGFDRFQPGTFKFWGGYLNTDSKIHEAEADGEWFTVLETPEVGCMIVGETFTIPGANGSNVRRIGHEGTVVDVSEWGSKGLAGISVVHCSPSNYKFTDSKSAIFKTSGALWRDYPKHVFLRFNRDTVLNLRKPAE